MTQASVTRISSMGSFESATICGYHSCTVGSLRSMRVSNCDRTCWISRGCERSARAFAICASVMGRANQVAFQNKNGMITKASGRTTMARAQGPPKDFCGLVVASAVVCAEVGAEEFICCCCLRGGLRRNSLCGWLARRRGGGGGGGGAGGGGTG